MRSELLITASAAAAYGAALIAMDAALAARFGTGDQAAVYQAAYIVPTVLMSILSGGAILGTFVPIYARLQSPDSVDGASRFLGSALVLVLIVLALVCAAVAAAASWAAAVVASSFGPALQSQVAQCLRTMLPLVVLHGCGFVFVGALMASRERRLFLNLAPACIPLTGLLSYPLWDAEHGARTIALAYSVGAAIFAVWTGFIYRHHRGGSETSAAGAANRDLVIEFAKAYALTALSHGALSGLLVVSQSIAGSLSARDSAAFSYGSRLVLLGLAFLTTVTTNVALPHFSALIRDANKEAIVASARRALKGAAIVSLAIMSVWLLLADTVVDVIYARGALNRSDVEFVVTVQRWFLLQMPFYAVGVVCWRLLNTLAHWHTLFLASVLALAVDVGLAMALAEPMRTPGIAVAYVAAIAVWCTTLLLTLRGRLKRLA